MKTLDLLLLDHFFDPLANWFFEKKGWSIFRLAFFFGILVLVFNLLINFDYINFFLINSSDDDYYLNVYLINPIIKLNLLYFLILLITFKPKNI